MKKDSKIDFYTTIVSMEPFFPDDPNGELESLALDLILTLSKVTIRTR